MKNLAKDTGVKYVFPTTYAGFFAKRHMMFFLLSSFRFYPPLKNDGTSELLFGVVLTTCLSFLNGGKSEMRFINSIKRELSQKGKNASL